jgi:predicted alpha/beta-hydrolase family hydrolase
LATDPTPGLLVPTSYGDARARVSRPRGRSRGLLVLGHGAGGGVEAPDLLAVAAAAVSAGWTVARVEQPYRVAGRRAPDRAPRLDAAWIEIVAALRGRSRKPLVTGGRSSGARVACRTAALTGSAGVVCLAFPLQPPSQPLRPAQSPSRPGRPAASRAGELLGVTVPVLVVQGTRDPFGGPAALPAGPTVVPVDDDHSLRRSAALAADAVRDWLQRQVVT